MVILLVGPLLFERLRMPGLVGLIALGAVAGPSVTGLLERDATFVLLGTFGLLYLMFMAGVTLDLGEFRQQRRAALAFGLASFAGPMALALVAGMGVLGYGFAAAALLGSIVGSHTLLALPLARRLGVAGERPFVIATGATLVTDLLSLIVLAVVQGVVSGETGAGFWVTFAGGAAVWTLAVLAGLPRLAGQFFRRVRREDDAAFAFLLAAVFLAAWTASLVRLAPIIGAFLAGIALNRLVPKRSPLMTRLRFVGDAFLVPFFLVSVGLLVDVRVLGALDVWVLALAFTGLVVVGKGLATLALAPVLGFSRDEGVAVAGLTMPQAAATLAVTLVGFEMGLFDAVAVNAVVLTIVLTCLVGPTLVRVFGRRAALAAADAPYEPTEAPERIIVPLSNPETAEELMQLALLLRSPASEQPVYPLAVARGGPGEAARVAEAEALMERAVEWATAASVPAVQTVRIDDNPVVGIVRGVRELRASEIVAGWNGEWTPGTAVFGHVIDGVLEDTRAMMIVARLAAPLAAAQRMVVLVPPLLHREPGFARAARALKVLAAGKSLPLVVVAEREHAADVEARLQAAEPEATLTPYPVAQWRRLVRSLDGLVRPGDIVVALSVRSGSVAWRPGAQRLVRVLARRFPDCDLLSVTLSETRVDPYVREAEPSVEDAAGAFSFPPERLTPGLCTGSTETLLRGVIAPAFSDTPAEAAPLARLLALDGGSPERGTPEVTPGAVLYHTHTEHADAPALYVGTCPEGVRLPGASEPARVLLVALAPAEMDPDAYFRLLAAAARTVREPETVEALAQAPTPEVMQRVLRSAFRERLT